MPPRPEHRDAIVIVGIVILLAMAAMLTGCSASKGDEPIYPGPKLKDRPDPRAYWV